MNRAEQQFIETVWEHYRERGRHDLPWRKRVTPYRVLVSEMMLQQTQVERVVPKFREFVQRWPSAATLAAAPLGEVLRVWQGLGYNRRAKYLHEAAVAVHVVHRDRFPRTLKELQALPGVGPYTAAALMAFAYNEPVVLIETNVRTVYLHHFFKDRTDVTDRELLPLIGRTLDRERPRDWYSALLDYGRHLKRTVGNQDIRSRHYTKQAPFVGSDRQLRAAMLRALTASRGSLTLAALCAAAPAEFSSAQVRAQLAALIGDGLVVRDARRYRLPTEPGGDRTTYCRRY